MRRTPDAMRRGVKGLIKVGLSLASKPPVPLDPQSTATFPSPPPLSSFFFSTRFHPILYLRCSPSVALTYPATYLPTYLPTLGIAVISRPPISLSHIACTPSITVACPRRGRTQPLPIRRRRRRVRVDATRINEIHGRWFLCGPAISRYLHSHRPRFSFFLWPVYTESRGRERDARGFDASGERERAWERESVERSTR